MAWLSGNATALERSPKPRNTGTSIVRACSSAEAAHATAFTDIGTAAASSASMTAAGTSSQ